MKHFLFFVFTLAALSVGAQVKTGTVTYSIKVESGMEDNPFVLEMMKNAEITAAFYPKNSSVKTTMGVYMTTTTIIQLKKKKAITLMDAMGTKCGVNMTLSELKKQNNTTSSFTETNETKEILGYQCKKGTFTAEDGTTGEIWYTTDIKANMDGQQLFSITDKGFILEESSNTNGVMLRITATSVNLDPVNKESFSLIIPEGYKVMTPAEFEAMQTGN